MSYSPQMRGRALFEHAMEVNPSEVRAALAQLIQRQNSDLPDLYRHGASPDALAAGSFEGWKSGQVEFARRLARIAANHAARQNEKLRWKHRSVGLLRRLALLVMVIAVNMPVFL